MKHEYPKQLYRKGWDDLTDSVVVENEDEEDAARAEGFKMLSEEGEEAPRCRSAGYRRAGALLAHGSVAT